MIATRFLPLALASLGFAATATAALHERTVSLPHGSKIRVEVPAGYSFETERNQFGVTLVKMENPVWHIVVSALIFPEEDPASTTTEWQQNRLITFVADALSIAAEKDYNFKPLYPKKGSGTYIVFTDPRVAKGEPLPPEEFANLVGGVKAWPGTTIVFQILTDSLTSPEFEEMMRVFTDSFERR
ncbi:MAG: hypothetical protein ACREIA_23120 [Opitutaceae bacterium]